MDKGQYQLLISFLIIASVVTSIGILFYTSKTLVVSNQTTSTTKTILPTIITTSATTQSVATTFTTSSFTTTSISTSTTTPECKCSWFVCNQNCGNKAGSICILDNNCIETTTSTTTSSSTTTLTTSTTIPSITTTTTPTTSSSTSSQTTTTTSASTITTTSSTTTTTTLTPWINTTSLVGTVTTMNGWVIDYPKHRKVFFMSGLFWIFYASNGVDLVYKTSSDLSTWSVSREIITSASGGIFSGDRFGLWFDGTYLHLAYSNSYDGEPIRYRRGTPNGDGTITWGTEYTAYSTPPTKNVKYTAVIADSDGYPWVFTMQFENGQQRPPYSALVIRNDKKDGSGTWTVNTLVTGITSQIPMPVGCPLTGNKTYWIYLKNTTPDVYYGKLWNGTSWENEEQATISVKADPLYNVVCDGNDVHLSFGNIKYRKRTWGIGWGPEFTVTHDSGASGHQTLTRTGTNSVAVTWENKNNDHLYYREMINGNWQPQVDWIDESNEHFAPWLSDAVGNRTRGINHVGLINSAGFAKIVEIYTTGSPSTYKLKVAALTHS
jgi:hypothetical protein